MCRITFYGAFGGMLLFTLVHQLLVNTKSFNPVRPDFNKQNPDVMAYEQRGCVRQFQMLEYQAKHPITGK